MGGQCPSRFRSCRAEPHIGFCQNDSMLLAFSIAPLGTTESVCEAVADAVAVVRDSGLDYRLDAMFTTVEGEWTEVFETVRKATEAVAAHGHRLSLTMKADIRPGHHGELTGKVDRVETLLQSRDSRSGAGPDH